MSPVTTIVDPSTARPAEVEDVLSIEALERAWHGPDNTAEKSTSKINSATLTVTRNGSGDFQDRQVMLYVDGELWGKVRYGRPMTREIPPGHHKVRAFNTMFSHTIEINAIPGEHVRLKCTNGLARGGWIMMVLWQVAALSVKLERE
ncbi:MAG TPA: hypothetical protein VM096_03625 [Vicinamibacterales bacterium]|nr:hypothetical protein [Vicinamibacterales bacterium]